MTVPMTWRRIHTFTCSSPRFQARARHRDLPAGKEKGKAPVRSPRLSAPRGGQRELENSTVPVIQSSGMPVAGPHLRWLPPYEILETWAKLV